MTDNIKPRKNITLNPLDLARTYTDSTFNQGSLNVSSIIGNASLGGGVTSTFSVPPFDPGALGGRTTPGDAGFAYAHTPEATVYIQKKQWVEQEWSYITTTNKERKGKNQELLTQIALSNLITRKLDLLNNHELFTKFSELNAVSAGIQQTQAGSLSFDINDQNLVFDPKAVADILTLAGNPTTKYYTETVTITTPPPDSPAPTSSSSPAPASASPPAVTPKREVLKYKVQVATTVKVITKSDDPYASRLRIWPTPSAGTIPLGGIIKGKIVKTIGPTSQAEADQALKNGALQNVDSIPTNLPSDKVGTFPIAEWWVIDLKALTADQVLFKGTDQCQSLSELMAATDQGVGYIAKLPIGSANTIGNTEGTVSISDTDPRVLAKAQTTIAIDEEKDLGPSSTNQAPVQSPTTSSSSTSSSSTSSTINVTPQQLKNVFNGVIELANISSITTSIANKTSPGTATVTLENPNNVLMISEDDIEIALGTRTIDDEVVSADGDEIVTTDPITGQERTLYYYDGKYYTATAYNLVSNTALGSIGNFSTSSSIEKLKQSLSKLQQDTKNVQIYQGTGLVTEDIKNSLSVIYSQQDKAEGSLTTLPKVDQKVSIGILVNGYDIAFLSNGKEVTNRLKQLQERVQATNIAIKQLMQHSPLSKENAKDTNSDYIRSQMRKYFQNKTIFEVYDRIFIWMSSPSRTTNRLEDGTLVAEASNANADVQIFLQRIQEIISLLEQIDVTIQLYAQQVKTQIPIQFTKATLNTINEELFASGNSKTLNRLLKGQTDAQKELVKQDTKEAEATADAAATAAAEATIAADQLAVAETAQGVTEQALIDSIEVVTNAQAKVDNQEKVIKNIEDNIKQLQNDQANDPQNPVFQVEIDKANADLQEQQAQLAKDQADLAKAQEAQTKADDANNAATDKVKAAQDTSDTATEASNTAAQEFDTASKSLKKAMNARGGIASAFKAEPTISILVKTIQVKIKDLQIFVKGANTTATAHGISAFQNATSTDGSIQGLSPATILKPDSLAGVSEQQFQVFQGVITNISRDFNDGKFTITLQCADNLDFLRRSRYTSIPAMQTVSPAGIGRAYLNDPIWRDNDLTKQLFSASNLADVVGRWKTGALALSFETVSKQMNSLNNNKQGQGKVIDSTSLPDSSANQIVSPVLNAWDEPFQGDDVATILSKLITGQPFDPLVFLQNALFTGGMNVPTVDPTGQIKSDEKQIISFGETVRQNIMQGTKKYGDFQPYLHMQGPTYTEQDRNAANLACAIKLGAAISRFVKQYVANRADLFNSAKAGILAQEKANSTGIFANLDKNNINNMLNFSLEQFPLTVGAITLVPNAVLDSRLQFLTTSAFRSGSVIMINGLLSKLTTAANDQAKFAAIVSETSSDTAAQFLQGLKSGTTPAQIYSISSEEAPAYNDIISAAIAWVNAGTFFSIAFKNGRPNNEITQPSTSKTNAFALNLFKQIAALRGVTMDAKGTKVLSGNALQATRASILFKQKPNFFVVSDEYLKNPDLVDYAQSQSSSATTSQTNQYKTVLERCSEVTKQLDWEIYADTQGHIVFKPPTYNRTLLRHIADLSRVETLFQSPFLKLFDNVGLLVPIQLLTYQKYQGLLQKQKQAALDQINNYLIQAAHLKIEQAAFSATATFGLSAPLTIYDYLIGEGQSGFAPPLITKNRLREIKALLQAPPTALVTINGTTVFAATIDPGAAMSDIDSEAKAKGNTADNQTTINPKEGQFAGYLDNIFHDSAITDANDEIKAYIEGLEINTVTAANPILSTASSILFGNATDPDGTAKAINKAIEICISIAKFCSDVITRVNSAQASLQADFAAPLQIISDEQYIHIIPSAIILKETYEESPPDFNQLNVYAPLLLANVSGTQSEQENTIWAGATDFDLWRLYGFIASNDIQAHFLQGQAQALIYAQLLIARQYGKILHGRIDVIGDSKYQIGDTIFIEDEAMYYYITAISHNFGYGQNYTTTLTLEYGRRIGQYIPYPFDFLGGKITESTASLYSTDGIDLAQFFKAFKQDQTALAAQQGTT